MAANQLEQAQELINSGDFPAAKKIIVEILNRDPENVSAWGILANLVEDRSKKVDCYRQVLRLDPGNQLAATQLAELEDRPAHQPPPERQDVIKLLHEVGLAALDRETLEHFKKLGVSVAISDDGYISLSAGSKVIKLHKSSLPARGYLSTDEIIEKAGDPLPPDKRRSCPRCDAVISQQAARCEWCNLSFGADGEPIWET